MRNWIIGAAALLAVAAPGIASAATGYAGVAYNNTDVNGAGNNDAWAVQGAVAFSGSSQISFEVDASIGSSDASDTVSNLAGHVFTRDDDHLLGGFVGVSAANSSTIWLAGLEANKYFENWTLAGAIGYANDDDANADAWGVNVQARVFPTDNFRLQANAGWAQVNFDGGGDDNAWTAGVGGEYQFSQLPVSVALNYDRVEFNDANVDANVWTVALRYNWGGALRARDRTGASQADLINFGRFFAL